MAGRSFLEGFGADHKGTQSDCKPEESAKSGKLHPLIIGQFAKVAGSLRVVLPERYSGIDTVPDSMEA